MNAMLPLATDDDAPLYVGRRKIFPQSVSGRFRNAKWAILAGALGIYYLLPFIRWDRGPHLPDQAVLLDLAAGRFYFFFIEIWPQEIYYITGLLILAAMSLFLMNAVAGRVWCGYLCPQTVWTDLFYAVERRIEGDRRERMRAAQRGSTLESVAKKILKHWIWLMIAWWTGGAWVLYFADAPTLVHQLLTFQAPTVAYAFIGTLTFTTYVLAGFMREQVCTYMCPWPRIQAALTDEHALNVTYRYDRGEPRGSLKKAAALRSEGKPAGDCVDCNQCVAVCPTGVDIRNGLQLDCIQCGLCIDACDAVMEKIGRPSGLIAYDSEANLRARIEGRPRRLRIVRPRTVLYAAILALVGGVMLYGLATRTDLALSVLHDRNPLFVRLSDGAIRNAFTVRILNKDNRERRFRLDVTGLPALKAEIADGPGAATAILVGPDRTRELRLLVTTSTPPKAGPIPLIFRLADEKGRSAEAADHFEIPGDKR
jgi:cytochrome c oxidase accessory protein FixG